jgi:hypothetical protein
MRILIAEYPKSGGNWLVNLLGDALSLDKRDIYINDDYTAFNVSLHPWYKGTAAFNLTESCVIKSHEFPESVLHNFPAHRVHLIRDCRDVIVSKYFFERDFCVQNGIYKEFTISFDDFVAKTAEEWAAFVRAWKSEDVVIVYYEYLLRDALAEMKSLFGKLGLRVEEAALVAAIRNNTKEAMKKSLGNAFQHNTFVRKGIEGDWKNHFSERHKEMVKKYAGTELIMAGYEKDNDW